MARFSKDQQSRVQSRAGHIKVHVLLDSSGLLPFKNVLTNPRPLVYTLHIGSTDVLVYANDWERSIYIHIIAIIVISAYNRISTFSCVGRPLEKGRTIRISGEQQLACCSCILLDEHMYMHIGRCINPVCCSCSFQ